MWAVACSMWTFETSMWIIIGSAFNFVDTMLAVTAFMWTVKGAGVTFA